MSRRPALVLAAALAAAACAGGDGDPERSAAPAGRPPATTSAKESHVFEIKSSADLPRLRIEYMRLWSRGTPGELAVKIDPSAALQATSGSPVAYAELPGAQHAFDGFQSVRCGSVINGMEWFTAWVRTTRLRVV